MTFMRGPDRAGYATAKHIDHHDRLVFPGDMTRFEALRPHLRSPMPLHGRGRLRS